MSVQFVKMQGIGNDFILIDDLSLSQEIYSKLAAKICDRHFGIGGDGLIVAIPTNDKCSDYKMRIYNSDGSEAEMCGNGIRCFAHYLKYYKNLNSDKYKIDTKAGIKNIEIKKGNVQESKIKVDMGKPSFSPKDIPVNIDRNIKNILEYPISIKNRQFKIHCVSMGNPHCIIFLKKINKKFTKKWGPFIESLPLFPKKTNVEFIEVINKNVIKMEVWERGTGRTLACGSGACAAAVAGIKKGLLDNDVEVHLPGGTLFIEWYGSNVKMIGPARNVFQGTIKLKKFI